MKVFSIKVVFDTDAKGSPVRFDTFENAIIGAINKLNNDSIPVFVQYPMPVYEFYNIITVVCERLRYNTDFQISLIPLEYILINEGRDIAKKASYCIQVSLAD